MIPDCKWFDLCHSQEGYENTPRTGSQSVKGKIRECAQRFRIKQPPAGRDSVIIKLISALCFPLKWESAHIFSPPTRMDSVGFADVQSEDELYDFDMDMDPPNWQQLVSREVLMGLKPYEIKRQEVINGEMEVLSYLAKLRGETFPWSFDLKISN